MNDNRVILTEIAQSPLLDQRMSFRPETKLGLDAPVVAPEDDEFGAIASKALNEFEALVDEIAAELTAHWDSGGETAQPKLQFDSGAPGDASRDDGIRQYARELVAAAYVNQDNSLWDPSDAQTYAAGGVQTATLLPALLSLARAEEDDSLPGVPDDASDDLCSADPSLATLHQPTTEQNSVPPFVSLTRC